MNILKIFLGILLFVVSSLYFIYYLQRIFKFLNIALTKNINIIIKLCALIFSTACLNYLSYFAIIIYHFIIFSLLVDLIFLIYKKIKKNNISKFLNKIICFGLIPLLLVSIIIAYGFININTVFAKNYEISSYKIQNNYKFLLISDIHYGKVQNKNVLNKQINKINKLNLDFVILDGDIVDEFTSLNEMQEVFNKLGSIKTKYGIFYVYGNHDRQNKTIYKSFTPNQLYNTITNNNIVVLSDEYFEINSDLVLIGREDYEYFKNRKSLSEIIEPNNKFKINIDHQPIDLKESSANNIDLQVSGHTHDFQVWPLGSIIKTLKFYTYGKYNYKNTRLIVSSGFAGWGFPLRTENHCEYVVVNLTKK